MREPITEQHSPRSPREHDRGTKGAHPTFVLTERPAITLPASPSPRELLAIIEEMRTIQLVAGQCSAEGPDDAKASMAAAESERCRKWADRLAALASSPTPEQQALTQGEVDDSPSNSTLIRMNNISVYTALVNIEGSASWIIQHQFHPQSLEAAQMIQTLVKALLDYMPEGYTGGWADAAAPRKAPPNGQVVQAGDTPS